MTISKFIRYTCLLALVLLPAMAQALPVQPQINLDYTNQVSTELYKMVDQHIDLFVSDGLVILRTITIILLVYYSLFGMMRDVESLIQRIFELLFAYTLAYTMLQFYDSPLPFGNGLSFHQIIPQQAKWIAQTLDQTIVNDLLSSVHSIITDTTRPQWWDVYGCMIYGGLMLNLCVMWVLASGVTLVGHLAIGFGSVLGPELIPFFVWPSMSFLFWGWLRFMLIYSFYTVASSAIVYVYAHVMMWFINNLIGFDYSLAHFAFLIVPIAALNGIFVIGLWQAHSWARDIVSGSDSHGSPFGALAGAATRLFV